MKTITVVTPCYNEEDNIEIVYLEVQKVFADIESVRYEHLFIDNCSTDSTASILRKIAKRDPNVKVILNSRNFGPIRSPYYGLMQSQGDAAILLVADLQDPPELIKEFISYWLAGYRIVIGQKPRAEESALMFSIRKLYYKIIARIADIELIQNFTGFGLYDRKVLNELSRMDDAYPYFRGLICETGFAIKRISYVQPKRKYGVSKFNFHALYDVAMSGITSHSKVPLRLATMFGFVISTISLTISLLYLLLKILYWDSFPFGTAPILIGMFFFTSVQLFFIGILGEYVGAILTQVKKRPLVIEAERINF